MARLQTRPESTLSEDTRSLLYPTQQNGVVPAVYLQFANSETSLQAYFSMEDSLRQGSLPNRDIEAVKLLVSELSGCAYCLSIHTMKATAAGISRDMQQQIRNRQPTNDQRLDNLLAIVDQFFTSRGALDDGLLATARANGISDQMLVDLAMAVSTIFFTNIVNHINDTDLTLPAAPVLEKT